MDKKSLNELRRRLKKDSCTFTKMCGCYVDDQKNIVTKIDESFMNLEDEEYFKFLEIAKKVISTNIGNNILELEFPLDEEQPGGHQQFLMGLKKSGLKDEGLLDSFYQMIIDNYESLGNYLIILYHDVYDVLTKTNDNMNLDESEETYEYIICAICPMLLSKPGLGYDKEDNKIGTLRREWIVGMPETGFIFPAFNERSSDIHSIHMYTADTIEVHTEMIDKVLGCKEKLTNDQKHGILTGMVFEEYGEDYETAKDVMSSIDIELAYTSDREPEVFVSETQISEALKEVGFTESKAEQISNDYLKQIDDELPLLSDIIPKKSANAVKNNNEKVLLREEIKDLTRQLEKTKVTGGDIIIKVNADKEAQIRQESVNGQMCVVIPVNDNEEVRVN